MFAPNANQHVYGRFLWRALPIVLMPLGLLLLAKPLAHHRSAPLPPPDYTVCLHRADILYKDFPRLELPPIRLFETRVMLVTAYCPCTACCGPNATSVTASGHRIQPGDAFVAADPEFAFGTSVIVPGYNGERPVRVLDRGSAVKGEKLDVFFCTHREAVEWGVRELTVTILIANCAIAGQP